MYTEQQILFELHVEENALICVLIFDYFFDHSQNKEEVSIVVSLVYDVDNLLETFLENLTFEVMNIVILLRIS